MPNVVPISKIDAVTKESVARVVNGLVALKRLGLQVRLPKEIQISMLVCPDGGINAVSRVQSTGLGTKRVTSQEGEQIRTNHKEPVQSSTVTTVKGVNSESGGRQDTGGSETQSNTYGRGTTTVIAYQG